MEATTSCPLGRKSLMVLALVGDSTMTTKLIGGLYISVGKTQSNQIKQRMEARQGKPQKRKVTNWNLAVYISGGFPGFRFQVSPSAIKTFQFRLGITQILPLFFQAH